MDARVCLLNRVAFGLKLRLDGSGLGHAATERRAQGLRLRRRLRAPPTPLLAAPAGRARWRTTHEPRWARAEPPRWPAVIRWPAPAAHYPGRRRAPDRWERAVSTAGSDLPARPPGPLPRPAQCTGSLGARRLTGPTPAGGDPPAQSLGLLLRPAQCAGSLGARRLRLCGPTPAGGVPPALCLGSLPRLAQCSGLLGACRLAGPTPAGGDPPARSLGPLPRPAPCAGSLGACRLAGRRRSVGSVTRTTTQAGAVRRLAGSVSTRRSAGIRRPGHSDHYPGRRSALDRWERVVSPAGGDPSAGSLGPLHRSAGSLGAAMPRSGTVCPSSSGLRAGRASAETWASRPDERGVSTPAQGLRPALDQSGRRVLTGRASGPTPAPIGRCRTATPRADSDSSRCSAANLDCRSSPAPTGPGPLPGRHLAHRAGFAWVTL